MELSPSEKYLIQMLQERGVLEKSEAEIGRFINETVRKHGSWAEKQEFFDAGYNADHWISVKDRLPTEKDGVIHSTNVGEVGKPELWRYVKILAVFPATEYEPAYVAETKFFVEKERREYAIPFTHWQPLPPLPKDKPDNNFCAGCVYPKNRWHYPSKGEFPEEFKLVAVSIKGFDYTTTGLYVQKKEGRYTRFVDEWLCQIPYHAGEYRSNEDIIAWQYLPEPQKEADNA